MKPKLILLLLSTSLPAQFAQRDGGLQPPSPTDRVAYDSARDRMVALIGSQTWEHDGTRWAQANVLGAPPARYEGAMVYAFGRVFVFGGQSDNGPALLGDTWAFDGIQWQQFPAQPSDPSPRRGHSMAFDSARNRIVMFGGALANAVIVSDTWEFDGGQWISQNPPVAPSARVWHNMVYDPVRARTLVHSGANNPSIFQDTWEYDGTTWTQISGAGPARLLGGLVFDAATQRPLLVGGQDAQPGFQGPHVFDANNGTWTALAPANPIGQHIRTGAAYDSTRNRTLALTQPGAINPGPHTYLVWTTGSLTASYSAFGQGCPGGLLATPGRPGAPLPPPQLGALPGSLPIQGTTFGIELNQIGSASPVFLFLGLSSSQWNGAPLPLDLTMFGLAGCPLLVSPDAVTTMNVTGTGEAEFGLTIPLNPILSGVGFFQQALTFDATTPNGVGATSNGTAGVLQ